MKKSKLFHLICVVLVIFLPLLGAFPLVVPVFNGLAMQAVSGSLDPTVTIPADEMGMQPENTQTSPPNPLFLVEQYFSGLNAGTKPVYDQYLVSERIKLKLPTALPAIAPYYGEKVVYLTFDDGPDSENTPPILAILKKNGVKATFFVLGTQVEKYPAILQQIFLDGHAVGNHSYNHIYKELYQSVDTYAGQLYRNDNVIKNVIGVRPRISRAPGGSCGSFTKVYWERLKKDGYIEVGWNISSGDASRAKAQQLLNNIIYQLENKALWSHAIVLMHDGPGHAETVKALPEIIQLFMRRGFEFRVVNLETPSAW